MLELSRLDDSSLTVHHALVSPSAPVSQVVDDGDADSHIGPRQIRVAVLDRAEGQGEDTASGAPVAIERLSPRICRPAQLRRAPPHLNLSGQNLDLTWPIFSPKKF